jgi:hypothetical protein
MMANEKAEEKRQEIEDEYDLSLDSDVLDESLLEGPSNTTFTITSYGADYTVDTLINRMKSEAFYVPTFQRNFVWSKRHASRFIESLLMGLPVPGIFLYKETPSNRHLVVDGQQRLKTLQSFYSGLFKESSFRLIGVRDEWEGKTYSELSASDRLKLDDSVVHATIFQQDEPKDNQKSLYFVFERINSGGIRLSPQEIRNCINDGPLLHMIRLLNEDKSWRKIFGEKTNARLKDQELILRFLAMMERADQYARPMSDFLNEFTSDFSSPDQNKLRSMADLFSETIKVCYEAMGTAAFRPSGVLNAAVFEAVTVGIGTRIRTSNMVVNLSDINMVYLELLANTRFMRACDRATSDEESVKTRQSLAIDAFKDV